MGAKSSVGEKDFTAVVAVGVTGAGKSTTCNNLAGQNFTAISEGLRSGTGTSKYFDVVRNNASIRIVDTVGFLTNRNDARAPSDDKPAAAQPATQEEVEQKFQQLAPASIFGIDVFLFMERYGRFTEEGKRHFDMFIDMAGPQALKHTILVFTHVQDDVLQRDLANGTLPKPLQEVVAQVHSVVGIENVKAPKVAGTKLTQAILDLVESNRGRRYTSDALRAAQQSRADLMARVSKLNSAERRQVLGRDFRALASGGRTHAEVLRAIEEAEAAEAADPRSHAPRAHVDSLPPCIQGLVASCAAGLALLREKFQG